MWTKKLEAEKDLERYLEMLQREEFSDFKLNPDTKVIITYGDKNYFPSHKEVKCAFKRIKEGFKNEHPLIAIPWWVKIDVLSLGR